MSGHSILMAQLERQFCPPLDPATLLAIVSDYDILKKEDLAAVRRTLGTLTEGADVEGASGFDPSGSSGHDNHISPGGCESESGQSSMPGWTSTSDDTSLSQELSALNFEGLDFSERPSSMDPESEGSHRISSDTYNLQLESADVDNKEAILIETFPGLKPFDIKWTLNKCKGNAVLAIDELLHQVFLEENGARHKGIEAFSETDLPERQKKGKGKKQKVRMMPQISSQSSEKASSSGPIESKWDTGRRDVEFIASKTGIPMTQVGFMYHEHGASVPATLNAIIDAHLARAINATDPTTNVNANDLSTEFPTIPPERVLAVAELTHPSSAAAHELAIALTTRQPRQTSPIQIDFRLPPPITGSQKVETKPNPTNAVFAPAPASPGDPDYLALRNTAFTQARIAHRAAKSNPLMGGAVSYYSQLGRDYSARAATQTSAEADALVASQSSASLLDLHGVNVKDAVRIAREGVTAWWAVKRGVEPGVGFAGFKIITGRGVHSEGGRSKLGPAVGRMLIREGWKVQVGSGAVLVTGVALKR